MFFFIFRACVFIVFPQSKPMCGEFSMVFPIWIQDIVFVSTSVLMTRFFVVIYDMVNDIVNDHSL
jgi:hypothetical protein